MAATNRIAPPAIIAREAAALLDQIAARPVFELDAATYPELDPDTDAHLALDPEAATRAVGRAVERLIAGVRWKRDGTTITFQSWSRPAEELEHTAGPESCTCEAGQEQRPCWHRAARSLILRLERQAQECDERPAPTHCIHCGDTMRATTTPAGEPCYECIACGWTAMASLYVVV